MIKSSELAEYIKKNAKHNSNGTYEVRNICFEVDVPYVLSYLDEGVGLDWYEKVYEPVSEPQIDGVVAKLKANKLNKPKYIKWCKDGVIVFDYSKMIYDNDKTENNFDDFIKEKISLYTYVDSGIYDLALTEICVNIAKAEFVYRD